MGHELSTENFGDGTAFLHWEVVRVQAKSLTWDFSPFYFGPVHYTNTISDDLATYFRVINVALNHTVNEAELRANVTECKLQSTVNISFVT